MPRFDEIIFLLLLIGVPILLLVGNLTVVALIMIYVITGFSIVGLWVVLNRVERVYKRDLKWTEAKLKRVEKYRDPNNPYHKGIEEEYKRWTNKVNSIKAWLQRFRTYKFCFCVLLLFAYFWVLFRIFIDRH